MTSREFAAIDIGREESAQLEHAIELERTLAVFVTEAVDLSGKLFASPEEATEAGSAFREEWHEEFEAIGTDTFYPDLRATGEGIIIPNTFVGLDEEAGAIVISLEEGKSAERTEFYESAIGRLDGVHVDTYESGLGEGLYTNRVTMSLVMPGQKGFSVSSPGLPVPVFYGAVQTHMYVPINEGIAFDVPLKSELEKQLSVAQALSESGLRRSRLIQVIDEVGGQLLSAEDSGYKELENIDRVQWLARQCVDYAKRGTCSIGILTDKLLEVFKKGAPLKISHADQGIEALKGKVYDVYPSFDDDGEPTRIFLALDISQNPKEPDVKSFPLDELTEIHY